MSDFSEFFGTGFDTSSVPPATGFNPLPPGKYTVQIEQAEVKTTKSGNGHYLEIAFTVLGDSDGKYQNRKLWDRINIDNPSQQCVEIGLRSLAALGQSVGLKNLSSTEQLLNQVCVAHVRVKDEQNEIRTYSAAGEQAATNNAVQPGQAAIPTWTQPTQAVVEPNKPEVAKAGCKPPWAR